ncbi:hypothetical protein, partial [Pantoea sp. GbtcB22]|uniref:hypothetical protein n=1 Tax=Pantoea sp. GbtcB22 TaxID=2824767 RepID=UPI001C2FF79F
AELTLVQIIRSDVQWINLIGILLKSKNITSVVQILDHSHLQRICIEKKKQQHKFTSIGSGKTYIKNLQTLMDHVAQVPSGEKNLF